MTEPTRPLTLDDFNERFMRPFTNRLASEILTQFNNENQFLKRMNERVTLRDRLLTQVRVYRWRLGWSLRRLATIVDGQDPEAELSAAQGWEEW